MVEWSSALEPCSGSQTHSKTMVGCSCTVNVMVEWSSALEPCSGSLECFHAFYLSFYFYPSDCFLLHQYFCYTNISVCVLSFVFSRKTLPGLTKPGLQLEITQFVALAHHVRKEFDMDQVI